MVKITRINTNKSGKSAVTASSLVKLMDRMTRDDSKNSVGAFRDFVVMAQNHASFSPTSTALFTNAPIWTPYIL